MNTPKKFLNRLFKYFSYLTFLGVVTLFGLELCYRTYVFDFYSNLFKSLNQPNLPIANNSNVDQRILVMGDSFTADPNSYVQVLRDSLINSRIYNSGIPGTSIKEAGLMLKRRLRQTSPTVVIYQIYVGNDLLEFRHPYQGHGLTFLRKAYWWLSDKIWVLAHINRQLPHLRQRMINDLPTYSDPRYLAKFNKQTYSARTKLYCQIEPNYLQNTIQLKGDQADHFEKYSRHLRKFINAIPQHIPVYILAIPHCIQVNHKYVDRMSELGCVSSGSILEHKYPFIEQLKSKYKSTSNVSIINALPQLSDGDLAQDVYYGNDPHLNLHGQQVIGRLLLPQLNNDN